MGPDYNRTMPRPRAFRAVLFALLLCLFAGAEGRTEEEAADGGSADETPDATAIDEVMRLGMNHPMGPLALADLIGLDICLDILAVLSKGFQDPKYRPCPLLVKMVDAGYLGRKSGRGFYTYDDQETKAFHPTQGYR